MIVYNDDKKFINKVDHLVWMPGKITSYNNVSPSFAVASAYFECSCLFSCLLTFTIPASESSFGTAFPGSCIATLYLCTLPLFLLPC